MIVDVHTHVPTGFEIADAAPMRPDQPNPTGVTEEHYLRLHFFDDAEIPSTHITRRETLDGVVVDENMAKFTVAAADGVSLTINSMNIA